MNLRLALLVAAIFAASVSQSVMAQNQLTFEESSSTSLTVTYTTISGSTTSLTVTPVDPDFWTVQYPSKFVFAAALATWTEPGSTTQNFVSFSPPGIPDSVFSDLGGTAANPDEFPVFVGFDTSNNGTIQATFDDDGDVATTIPETGSTFGLLLLALVALLSATRFRHLRLCPLMRRMARWTCSMGMSDFSGMKLSPYRELV